VATTEASAGSAVSPASVASADVDAAISDRAAASASSATSAPTADAEPAIAAASAASPALAALAGASASASAVGPAAALVGAGEQPPPTYRTSLPAAATLHYQVRRGFLRGDGEIRWQPAGDRYRLVLEARVAGLTLLVQTSEGAVDGAGLAPERFLDQRARRSPQAANFVRGSGRVTWSATTAEAPLLAGAQDRLSWMVQLAGIAAANPELLVEGGRIAMEVVGARGDAAVWTLRCAGSEDAETANGVVHAVKLVRDGRSAYDTTAEVWLDPARAYLPAHATLRNSAGGSEYDLLLERIEP
jgi:hypothetical protein